MAFTLDPLPEAIRIYSVSPFLSPRDVARLAPTCRAFQKAFSYGNAPPGWFAEKVGILTPSEEAQGPFHDKHAYLQSQTRTHLARLTAFPPFYAVFEEGAFRVRNLERQGLWEQFLYYSGYYHAQLAQELDTLCARKIAQIDELFALPRPDGDFMRFHAICTRAYTLIDEVRGMSLGLTRSRETLEELMTPDLFFLIRWIMQIAQWFFSSFFGA